jgi:aryl-alcohol dehydrogenase-like predicted oxidoreductase
VSLGEQEERMELRKLGSDGPEISVVGYGAWEAGGDEWGSRSATETLEAMRSALETGVNWIDTAEVYGGGRSEELVGRAVAGRRDDVFIFTKVAPFGSGLAPDDVRRAIRASLRRLDTDHVDLYQIHWPERTESTKLEDTWGTMADLVDEGLARHVGVSNFDRDLVDRCEAIRHVDSVQNHFSLLRQNDRPDLLPWLAERGVGYLAYGPLAFGLLTGAIEASTTFSADDWRSGRLGIGYYDEFFAPGVREQHLRRVDALRPIAERLGIGLATLALRAAIEVPGVSGVIAGSTNPRHVRENAAAGVVRLDDATRREIDEVFGTAA